jgi:hypothetical protein
MENNIKRLCVTWHRRERSEPKELLAGSGGSATIFLVKNERLDCCLKTRAGGLEDAYFIVME